MDTYHRLVLKRHLKRQIVAMKAGLKELQPGTDAHEMALGYLHDAQDSLARLQRIEQTAVVQFPHGRQPTEVKNGT